MQHPSLQSCLILLAFFLLHCDAVALGHVHKHIRHRHHPRAQAPATTSDVLSPSALAAAAGVPEIADLSDLPKDLFVYVIAIEQRLLELEDNLAGLLAKAARLEPTLAATTQADHTSTATRSSERESSSVVLCHYPGIETLVPCTTAKSDGSLETTSLVKPSSPPESSSASAIVVYSPGIDSTVPCTTTIHRTITETRKTTAYTTRTLTHASSSGVPFSSALRSHSTASLSSPYPRHSISASYTSQSSRPTYTFLPEARDNLAVYYGSTQATTAGGLHALCLNSNVDIVILAFVFTFFTPHGYPSISFGPGCVGPNARQSQQAPGLSDCTALAPEITACQKLGKKVLVSLGGYIADTRFDSEDQTQQFAATLWSLFGPGTEENRALRPFGPHVVVDGFDIDNENHNTTYYTAFAKHLRARYAEDPSKKYYLSAAPQCPMPDESIPRGAMLEADFVWVQFYNNPACNLDSDGFRQSFAAWSRSLTVKNNRDNGPRLYIGAGAWEGAGPGYVQGNALKGVVGPAKHLGVENMGGMMLWDGSEGLGNVDKHGVDYLTYAKGALHK